MDNNKRKRCKIMKLYKLISYKINKKSKVKSKIVEFLNEIKFGNNEI